MYTLKAQQGGARQAKASVAYVLESYQVGGIFSQLDQGTSVAVHRSINYDFIIGMQGQLSKDQILGQLAKQHFKVENQSQWRQWINANFVWVDEDGKEVSFETRFGEGDAGLPTPDIAVI